MVSFQYADTGDQAAPLSCHHVLTCGDVSGDAADMCLVAFMTHTCALF